MSQENRTPTKQFVKFGDVRHSGDSASEGEDDLQLQLLDRRMSSSEVDSKINAIFASVSKRNNLEREIRITRLKVTQHLNDRYRRVNAPTITFCL